MPPQNPAAAAPASAPLLASSMPHVPLVPPPPELAAPKDGSLGGNGQGMQSEADFQQHLRDLASKGKPQEAPAAAQQPAPPQGQAPAQQPSAQQPTGQQVSATARFAQYPAQEGFNLLARESQKHGESMKGTRDEEKAAAWLALVFIFEGLARVARQLNRVKVEFTADDVRAGIQVLAYVYGNTAEPQYIQILCLFEGRAVELRACCDDLSSVRHARACALWSRLAACVNLDMQGIESLSITATVDGRYVAEAAPGKLVDIYDKDQMAARAENMAKGGELRRQLLTELSSICQAMAVAVSTEAAPPHGGSMPAAVPDNPMSAAARSMRPGG